MKFYAVILGLFLMSCQVAPPVTTDDINPLLTHSLRPSATDATITSPDNFHYSGLDTAKTPKNLLVLFLGGTGSDPAGYTTLLKEVLALGYHALSLNYPNTTAVGALALNDLAAYGQIRSEIVTGSDASPLVDVSASNSILNRTVQLLRYLALHYASENWSQYLTTEDEVDWSKVIISGYSQGAGHAAYIAKTHEVYRLVMFSGVVDGRVGEPYQSADWVAEAEASWQTPFSRFRFFESTHDGNYPAIRANLISLISLGFDPGDTSKASDVDGSAAPHGNRQALLTSRVTGDAAHPSTCENGATPVVGGVPVYRDVWRTLFN